jgi:transposase-like protein
MSHVRDVSGTYTRVHDKREEKKFTSKILPPYLRRSQNVESILPVLYLKGLSGNVFTGALSDLLGDEASGLSSSSISALKKSWEKDFNDWKTRDILEEFVYLWCDGVNMQVRLGDDKRACLLVVVGVTRKGEKKLLAFEGGYRESKESWKQVFSDLETRGLKSPLMLIGDGGLGLWAATREMELFKKTREQRCWVHKIANVLNCLPKRLHTQAKSLLHEMMKAPTKSEVNRQLGIFRSAFNDKYEKAYKCIDKDWEVLTSFFDFPASRGAGSVTAAEVMAFKLMQECEKKWRLIRGHQEIDKLLSGALYKDGLLVESSANQEGVA